MVMTVIMCVIGMVRGVARGELGHS
jgi:hypothetical protein